MYIRTYITDSIKAGEPFLGVHIFINTHIHAHINNQDCTKAVGQVLGIYIYIYIMYIRT